MQSTINANTLAGLQIFHQLPTDVRERLANRLHGRNYRRGHYILCSADTGREVYFLVAGRVQATLYSKGGREVIFQVLEAGQMFGELTAIDGKRRSTDVVALTDCFVGVMSQRDFMNTCRELPAVCEEVMQRLASLTRMLLERVFEFSTLGVNNRIHAELLRLARGAGGRDGPVNIRNAPTHVEIASRVSTNRSAVTRELNRLTRLGILDWGRSSRRILDVQRLQAMVDDVCDSNRGAPDVQLGAATSGRWAGD